MTPIDLVSLPHKDIFSDTGNNYNEESDPDKICSDIDKTSKDITLEATATVIMSSSIKDDFLDTLSKENNNESECTGKIFYYLQDLMLIFMVLRL